MMLVDEVRGGQLFRSCPQGYSDEGLYCLKSCPPGYRTDPAACRKCPDGYTDMGLHCQKWSFPPATSGQEVIWRDRFDKTDFRALGDEIQKGLERAFSEENLARAFDPEKNGVAESFRKFGKDTDAAFKDLGEKLERAFDPNQNGVASGMKKFGDQLGVALSDPDTWIMVIGTIASIAAVVLSGGTAGPAVVAALGALGPSMKIIGDVAQGRPVDPLDIASMTLAIIPGVGAAVGGFDDAVKAGVTAAKVASPAAKATTLGRVLAQGTMAANKIGNTAIRSGLVAKLDKVKSLASSIQPMVNKVRFIYRNPGSIRTLLRSPAITNEVPIVLSNAEKAKKYGEMGLTAVKAGVKIASIGEGMNLWDIPDISVPLEDINWDNPPDDLQYVFELPTDEASKELARKEELRLVEEEKKRQEEIARATAEQKRIAEENERRRREAEERERARIAENQRQNDAVKTEYTKCLNENKEPILLGSRYSSKFRVSDPRSKDFRDLVQVEFKGIEEYLPENATIGDLIMVGDKYYVWLKQTTYTETPSGFAVDTRERWVDVSGQANSFSNEDGKKEPLATRIRNILRVEVSVVAPSKCSIQTPAWVSGQPAAAQVTKQLKEGALSEWQRTLQDELQRMSETETQKVVDQKVQEAKQRRAVAEKSQAEKKSKADAIRAAEEAEQSRRVAESVAAEQRRQREFANAPRPPAEEMLAGMKYIYAQQGVEVDDATATQQIEEFWTREDLRPTLLDAIAKAKEADKEYEDAARILREAGDDPSLYDREAVILRAGFYRGSGRRVKGTKKNRR